MDEFHKELEIFLQTQIKKAKGNINDPSSKKGQAYLASKSILAEFCHFITILSNQHEDEDEKNKFIRAKLINWMLAHPRDSSIQSLEAVKALWVSAPENPKN